MNNQRNSIHDAPAYPEQRLAFRSLRRIAGDAGFKQESLAALLEVSQPTACRMEAGHSPVTFDQVVRIEDAYGVTPFAEHLAVLQGRRVVMAAPPLPVEHPGGAAYELGASVVSIGSEIHAAVRDDLFPGPGRADLLRWRAALVAARDRIDRLIAWIDHQLNAPSLARSA